MVPGYRSVIHRAAGSPETKVRPPPATTGTLSPNAPATSSATTAPAGSPRSRQNRYTPSPCARHDGWVWSATLIVGLLSVLVK